MEILAPAGGMEQLIAAVRCGADAVYLGAKGFNARQNAENFTDLAQAVQYCHARGVAVHVTVNTLVRQDELPALRDTLREVAEAGADAVITQDLAAARLARECCPSLSLHASTQMTIHNAEGARLLEALGFRRVVLARELTLSEIEAICHATSLEVECFVHGALCMSASGACELSAVLGGRSGNRGECAQPCRLNFRCGEREYALSLKDMCHIPHLAALQDAGVCSLKIEGRMKRPEYVAAATLACVDARDGRSPDLDRLQAVFSRSGFTDGYLTGKRTLDMFGHRTREDVTAAAGVLKALEAEYRDERPRVSLTGKLTVNAGGAELAVSDGIREVRTDGSVLPSDRCPNPEMLERNLRKTGGTPFSFAELRVDASVPAMLPASELNRMRRETLERLLEERSADCPKAWNEDASEQALSSGEPAAYSSAGKLRLRFEHAGQAFDDGASEVVLPCEQITREHAEQFGGRLIAELPALCFPADLSHLRTRLDALGALGVREVAADNLYALALGREYGFTVHGGPGLNIYNAVAAGEYARLGAVDLTASCELNLSGARALLKEAPLPVGLLVFGRVPLMRLRACPKNDCRRCEGQFVLTDRMGIDFPVLCRERKYQTPVNSVPLYLGDRSLPPSGFSELYFTVETREQAQHAAECFAGGRKPDFPRTSGAFSSK